MKNLLVDMGNSTTGLADYDGSVISNCRWIETASIQNSEQFLGYDRVVVASVVPNKDHYFPPNTLFIDYKNMPLLKINLTRPQDVGADRIVNALAAYSRYHRSCLIVDSGTATTFCYVTSDGVYEGGAIFPGMKLASQALNDHTAKIPLIWVQPRSELYGKNTVDAVQSGLYHGFIAMINGMIAKYRQIDSDIWVVGTGNGLQLLRNRLTLDAYDPELVFKGLAIAAV